MTVAIVVSRAGDFNGNLDSDFSNSLWQGTAYLIEPDATRLKIEGDLSRDEDATRAGIMFI